MNSFVHVDQKQTSLVAYGGVKVKGLSQVRLCICWYECACALEFCLVDKVIQMILGIKAFLAMSVIQYKGNDLLNKPEITN